MEDYEIPDGTVKAVARRLRHYMDVERLEEGFDLSGSSNLMGQFYSGRGLGGTLHHNSLQDKHMHHFLQNPLVRKRLESMGVVHKEMLQEMDKMVKKTHRQKHVLIHYSKSSQQRYHQRYENSCLLETTAKVLLQGHSFTGVASVETRTSESNEKESEAISRSDSYSFPQYSPVEHIIPRSSYREQVSSRLEGDGKLSEKEGACGDSYGSVYTYSTPPPTPPQSLCMLTTNTNISQKSDASHHTSSSNQESSITPSRESPFTPSQESAIKPSRKNPIMPSRESPIVPSQECPITPSQEGSITPSQDSPLIPSLESLTMASDTANVIAPQISPQANIPLYYGISPGHPLTGMPNNPSMYQANMAYPPPHMVPMSMLQQEGQPVVSLIGEGMFDSSMDMQANTFPDGREVGDNAAPRRKFPVVALKDACVSTMNTIDASTQTPVHAETQTDKSALYSLSEKHRKKQVQKKKSVSSKTPTKKGDVVSGLEPQGAANSYSHTSKHYSSRATRKGTSMYRDTSMSDKTAKLSAVDSHSNEESSSSMSSYSSRRSKSEGKDSSQTESPLQDKSAKLSDAVSCIQKGLSTSVLSDSTTRLKSKDDISILPNTDTHTIDYADHKSEYKEFQEAMISVVDTAPLFLLPPASPSQKGGEMAPKVEGLAMTQETLGGDTPLLSSSSIISSQQPPPHVGKTLFNVTTAPVMAAEGTEVRNTPLEYLPPPPHICEPLDVKSASITKVKETEFENTSPPLPPSTSPIISSVIAPLVATEDEGLSIKEPPISITSGHSAEVEIAKASATSVQGLGINDITEVLIQKNNFADPRPPLSAQKCRTSVLEPKEEDMASVPIASEKPLPPLSSPYQESITTVLVKSMDEIVSLQTFGEKNQGTLQQTLPSQPPPHESQSKTFLEVGKDLASAPITDQGESQSFSPTLLRESTTVGLESSSGNELNKANIPSPKDKKSPLRPPSPTTETATTEMSGRSGSQ